MRNRPLFRISLLNCKEFGSSLTEFGHALKDERGSAVVEFVVLTLPLFVPFALYLGVVNSQSQAAIDAHNLARQAARAYIASPSEEFASARVEVVKSAFTENILRKHGILSRPDIQISCEADPCLTPDKSVKAIVTLEDSSIKPTGYLRFLESSPTKVVASDIQIVDIWRSSQP